jgi:hypothetical protein
LLDVHKPYSFFNHLLDLIVRGAAAIHILWCYADTEGTALFNPEDKAQARFAFKITGARIRRQLSPEKREELAKRLQTARAQKAA